MCFLLLYNTQTENNCWSTLLQYSTMFDFTKIFDFIVSNPTMMAVIVLGTIVGVIFISSLIYLCYKCCCGNDRREAVTDCIEVICDVSYDSDSSSDDDDIMMLAVAVSVV